MALKVVNTGRLGGIPYDEEVLGKLGAEYVVAHCPTEEELIEKTRDADGVIALFEPFTRKVIERLTKCKIISNMGIGYDNIDVAAATEHGICVANVPDYCLDEMTDHTMALILTCARKIVRVNNALKSKLDRLQMVSMRAPVYKLRGQTLGIVGFGRIPRTLVPKARGFGFQLIAYDPYVPEGVMAEFGVERVELDRLLRESDFITIHASLTADNHHMFGLEQFKRMKKTAFLINTARGGLIDQDALYTALSEGYLAGAALDVLEPEFDLDNPLLQLENVIYTGHSGYYSETSSIELRRRPVEEVARVLQGEWPHGFVNPEVKERFISRWGRSALKP